VQSIVGIAVLATKAQRPTFTPGKGQCQQAQDIQLSPYQYTALGKLNGQGVIPPKSGTLFA
jgi:hypothetical protein